MLRPNCSMTLLWRCLMTNASSLLEALIASEDLSTRETFDSEILQEFKRRSDEIEAGVVQSSPWSQVRERVRKRLEERSRG